MTVFDTKELAELLRERENGSGPRVSIDKAMNNTAVSRCVHLISFSMGMLPLHLLSVSTKLKAKEHSLYKLLHKMPNDWQTAFNFRQLMQRRALVNGNAYALIVRSGKKIVRLVPLDPRHITPKQRKDWTVEYQYRQSGKAIRILEPKDVFHLYADSRDGITGLSTVQVAANAIQIAEQADLAARRLFENGMMVGGALSHQEKLSQDAHNRLKAGMDERHSGPDNAGKWLILEEGDDRESFLEHCTRCPAVGNAKTPG